MANENVIEREVFKIRLRDGNTYNITPLTLNKLVEVWPIIEKLEQAGDKKDASIFNDVKSLVSIILKDQLAPGIDVGDLVGMDDLAKMLPLIMGQSPVEG